MEKALDRTERSLEKLLPLLGDKGASSEQGKEYASLAFGVASLGFVVNSLEETDSSRVKELIQTEVKPVLKAAAARE